MNISSAAESSAATKISWHVWSETINLLKTNVHLPRKDSDSLGLGVTLAGVERVPSALPRVPNPTLAVKTLAAPAGLGIRLHGRRGPYT